MITERDVWALVPTMVERLIKKAEQPVADYVVPVGQYLGFKKGGPLEKVLPAFPSPMAAMLASSALGAGGGYLAGTALEQILPDKWRRRRLRRTLATAGGLLGATPALAYAATNLGEGSGLLSPGSWSEVKQADEFDDPVWGEGDASAGGFFNPTIPTDAFNRVVLSDPYTPPQVQAATTGVITAAAMSRGGNTQRSAMVSPADIARIGVGMGTGYVSGALVGKALGVLAGMPPETQQQLQQTGMWAGILTNVVPMLFSK